jgi:ABC-type dipeptide/oligopeptide/nickel transport system permease subunit
MAFGMESDVAVLAEADLADDRNRLGWLRSPKIIVGLVILAVFIGLALLGPLFDRANPSALSEAVLQPPSEAHWLGTTQSGQDVLAQLIVGTRSSLVVGFLSGALATVLSLIVGLTGGYLGGVFDELLSTVSNIFLVIPALPLVIVLAGYLPDKGSVSVTIVIAATGWAWGARVLRAQTLSIRRRDYVVAAKAVGERTTRILFAEIFPNEIAIVASSFLFTVIFAILTDAGLAFLGLANVSDWSWGTMLYWAQDDSALQTSAWWWFVPPGICIALVGTALALLNFGLDEFVNPRLRAAGIGTRASRRAAAAARASRARQNSRSAGQLAARSNAAQETGFTPVRREQEEKE